MSRSHYAGVDAITAYGTGFRRMDQVKGGFRYFKVSPVKAFRDILHVSADKVFATGMIIKEGNRFQR